MSIKMNLTPDPHPQPLGSSYFWDAPQLPKDADAYPCYVNADGDEAPMQFICQLNLAQLHIPGLPRHGMLYFFGLIDYFLGYDVPYEQGLGWWDEGSVAAVYADVDASQLERQNPFTEDDMIPPHPITISEQPDGADGMKLLGTPFEEEARMEQPPGWTLLLQLDSEENDHFSLMFHDMGLLYVFIEQERLQRGDFSHLRAYMTSM